jgi:hypothetical protein
MVTIPVATRCRSCKGPTLGRLLSLGEILSGWRDLNSRPLDPQIGPSGR